MKEGSFNNQITNLDFDIGPHDLDKIADEVRHIKIPDQVPDRIDLSQVPPQILRSGVIDTLIQQNEDLMARLTVTLRRVATLEEKLVDSQTESSQAKAKYENVKDQVLILREQSRMLAERIRQAEDSKAKENLFQNEAREQIQVLEIRYAELYTSSQDRQSKLEEKIAGYERMLRCYRKYRAHVKQIYTTLHAELKALRETRQAQENVIADLRQNVTETTDYITNQAKEHKNHTATLIAAYEAEINAHKGENDMLVEQNRVLGERSNDYERIYSEKIKLENDLIVAERREDELKMKTSVELSNLQKALARHRNDAKALSIDIENKTSELVAQTMLVNDLTEQKSALSEQVDTLQLLWRDQQNQLEKISEQKNSLQKLNQKLSISINEYRKEIRELKEKIDSDQQKAFELKNAEEKMSKVLNDLHIGR